jgi:hypothetical protein
LLPMSELGFHLILAMLRVSSEALAQVAIMVLLATRRR